jgi:hypothetical protein
MVKAEQFDRRTITERLYNMEKFAFWTKATPTGLLSRKDIFNWTHSGDTSATLRIEDDGRLYDTGTQNYVTLPALAVRVAAYSKEFAVTCADGKTYLGQHADGGIVTRALEIPTAPTRLFFACEGLQAYNADGSHWLYNHQGLKLVPKPIFGKRKGK